MSNSSRPPIRGYVDPNFPNPNQPGDASIIIYGYTPSFILAILGCVLFLVALIAHLVQLFKFRSWYFSTMVVGIAFEIVGYAFRILSAKISPYRVNYFVVQYFFIVVAPVFFAAAIYTVLSILISATKSRSYAPLSPKLILWIFITCDVVATVVQILGAALIGVASSNRKDPTTANNILLGGLAFQAASFLLFIVLYSVFLWRARKVVFHVVGKGFHIAFAAAVLLLYLRVCFRLAETAEGLYGKLNTNEVYFGVLEFMPVVLAVWLLAAWHPGRCVQRGVSRRSNIESNGF